MCVTYVGPARFAVEQMGWPEDKTVPKKVRQKIYNCYKAYLASSQQPEEFASSMPGVPAPYRAVLAGKRYRRRGHQGHPGKGQLLKHCLLQWFIDWRKLVSARIWPKTVLKQALVIKGRIHDWHIQQGKTAPEMPQLDLGKKGKKWLWNWRRLYSISFKKSQRKFKVSRGKLARRTKCTWLNCWAAMMVFKLLFGEERTRKGLPPWPYKMTADQKGIMLNEAESVNTNTLNFQGCHDDNGIRTNNGQSRTRISLFTMVMDHPSEDRPLEICYKLKTDLRTKDLKIPVDSPITVTNSPSGSYNYEATMKYLDRHIPKWTQARAETHDYRIFLLDDFRVHNMKEVKSFCWNRGVLKLKIGGGCTFILCHCDLDLHADIERDYLDIDIEWAADELRKRPWAVPTKTRQTFLDDWVCIWDRFPHQRRGRESFKLSGVGARPPERVVKGDGSWHVPLTGPDDWCINRDARVWFIHNNMPVHRQKLMQKIYEDHDAGKIREWEDVNNYLQEFSDSEDGGEHGEGEELMSEHPLSSGTETDLSEDEPQSLDHEEGASSAIVHAGAAAVGSEIMPVDGNDSTHLAELKVFENLISQAKAGIRDPRVIHLLSHARKEMERQLRGVDNNALATMEAERATSLDELSKKRQKLKDDEQAQIEVRKVAKEKKRKLQELNAKKKEKTDKLKQTAMLIDREWHRTDFGSPKASEDLATSTLTRLHKANIREYLQRTSHAWVSGF